ncbi:MAG: hypothetical protein MR819_11165, partial [Prevotella sp.]|nr:hypothetical protein [Prevotella sp.]
QQYRFPESECKGTAFFRTTKTFGDIFFEKYALFTFSLIFVKEYGKKQGEYRAVTRPTLGRTLMGK